MQTSNLLVLWLLLLLCGTATATFSCSSCPGGTICNGEQTACVTPVDCASPSACSNAGNCANQLCYCFDGRNGTDCSGYTCMSPGATVPCSGLGTCLSNHTCDCGPGYRSGTCSASVCAVNYTSVNELDYYTHCRPSTCVSTIGGVKMTCANLGTCVNKACACPPSRSGSYCEQCATGFSFLDPNDQTSACVPGSCLYNNKLCDGHGACSNLTDASASCVCGPAANGTRCANCTKFYDPANDCNSCVTNATMVYSSSWGMSVCSTCASPDCSNHGLCIGRACVCDPGWGGSACNQPAPCTATTPSCSGHGSCDALGLDCVCKYGYSGTYCSTPVCVTAEGDSRSYTLVTCNNHGDCVNASAGLCQCDAGYSGQGCYNTTCRSSISSSVYCGGLGAQACTFMSNGSSSCSRCPQDFIGPSCEQRICITASNNRTCNDQGQCVQYIAGVLQRSPVCECYTNWGGGTCEYNACVQKLDSCSGHGTCVGAGLSAVCACSGNWAGESCNVTHCAGWADANECGDLAQYSSRCNTTTGQCRCPTSLPSPSICAEGFTGSTCTVPTCLNPITREVCSGIGTCNATSQQCVCPAQRAGPTCRDEILGIDWNTTASVTCNFGNIATGFVATHTALQTCDPHTGRLPMWIRVARAPSFPVCRSGTGGAYCCPYPAGSGIVCGDHGTCNGLGLCVCASGWSKDSLGACTVNTACGGCAGGSSCSVQFKLSAQLAQLRLAQDSCFARGAINTTTVDLWVRTHSICTDQPTCIVTDAEVGVRVFVLGMTASPTSYSSSFLDCSYDVPNHAALATYYVPPLVNGGFDLFGGVTYDTDPGNALWDVMALEAFQRAWIPAGFTLATVRGQIDLMLARVTENVVVADATFAATAATNFYTAALALDWFGMWHTLASTLTYMTRLDVTTGLVPYPSMVGEPVCTPCDSGKAGTHCDVACPVGLNGNVCSGFQAGLWRGSCDTNTGTCVCARGLLGIACQIDTTALCYASGSPLVCNSHGACKPNVTQHTQYGCVCAAGWSGTFCETSVCSNTTVQCSSYGTCNGTTGLCACQRASLLTATDPNVTPLLAVGALCQYDGGSVCAASFSSSPYWRECSGHGTCTVLDSYGNLGCVCANGYAGPKCGIALCGSPGCNSNETCNTNTGVCACLPRYATPTGSCPSGSINCRCGANTCGNGVPSPIDGATCICNDGWRVDSSGSCTILQCPAVYVTDAGPMPCNSSLTCAKDTGSLTAYDYSHRYTCCYDACVDSVGGTVCKADSLGARHCACDPFEAYNEVNGVCYSKCSGQLYRNGVCVCDNSFPLYPPLDTATEYLSIFDCARVTCLNGGTVGRWGQNCVCTSGYMGATCGTPKPVSSSAATLSPSSTGGSRLHPSSSAPVFSATGTAGYSSSGNNAVVSSSSASVAVSSSGRRQQASSSTATVYSHTGNSNDTFSGNHTTSASHTDRPNYAVAGLCIVGLFLCAL
jgi:hypothetical protein